MIIMMVMMMLISSSEKPLLGNLKPPMPLWWSLWSLKFVFVFFAMFETNS